MIIPSPLITLDYSPAKDILVVEWPDLKSHNLTEVKHSLTDLINTLKFYDVKHLLIDSRKTVIDLPKEEYTKLASEFIRELETTRLQKVARIESNNKPREAQVRELVQITEPISFQNFSNKHEALDWLEAKS